MLHFSDGGMLAFAVYSIIVYLDFQMEDDTEGDSGDLCDSDDVTINNPQQESQPKTSSHLHQLLNVTPAAEDDLTHQVLL